MSSSLKRTNSASSLQKLNSGRKNGNLSARSTKSQESDVSDVLQVAGISNVKSKSAQSKVKPALVPNKTTQVLKPHIVDSFSSREDGKAIKKPAWALKPPIDDETPRCEISNTTWSRPSLDDFLDFQTHDVPVSVCSVNTLSVKSSNFQNTILNASKKKELFEHNAVTCKNVDIESSSNKESSLSTCKYNNSGKNFSVEANLQVESVKLDSSQDDFEIIKNFSDSDDSFPSWNTKLSSKKHKIPPASESNNKSLNKVSNSIYSNKFSKKNDIKVQAKEKTKILPNDKTPSSKNKDRLLHCGVQPSTNKEKHLPDEIEIFTNKNKLSNKKQFPYNKNQCSSFNESSGNKDETVLHEVSKVNSLIADRTNKITSQPHLKEEINEIKYVSPPIKIQEQAAKKIQSWWKQVSLNRDKGADKIQKMMGSKKFQIEKRMNLEKQDDSKKVHYDQVRRREEKARLARQKVIDEMHAKRLTKESNMKPQPKDNSFLTPSKNNKNIKLSCDNGSTLNIAKTNISPVPRTETLYSLSRPDTSSSVTRLTDTNFESSNRGTKSHQFNQPNNQKQNFMNYLTVEDEMNPTVETIEEEKFKEHSNSNAFMEIMNTLKELEDEPIIKEQTFDADENLTFRKADPGSLLSADKLQSIMDFLDNVVKVEDEVRTEVLSVANSHFHSPRLNSDFFKSDEKPNKRNEIDSVSFVASEISDAISAQKNEIKEKQKTVEMMKKAINQQKEFSSVQIIEMEKEHKQQLSLQRSEYEATIQRHLSFIDQLIDDKKVLTQRCEDLVSKLKEMDQRFTTKIKQMTESHALELKKQKDINEAAEKVRREKWIKEKTQEIKELTVKGLEPEIQRLITKHKAEIKAIKNANQTEVMNADERVAQKYMQQLDDLRVQYEIDTETAVQKERENCRERFEQQIQEEENSFQQQRRRLYSEIEEEKQRVSDLLQTAKKEFDERRNEYENTSKQMLVSLQEDLKKQLHEMQENCQNEMRNYKEQLEIEKQQWIENFMKKQETHLLSKERELKDKVKVARDQEIEMVIDKLERETAQSREDAERAAENRIKRIRDKYVNEIKDYEQSERALQDKCNNLKEQIEKLENDLIQLKSSLKHKDQEVIDVKKITDRLQEERGKVSDIIRQEYADRLVATEEESNRLRKELSEEKARRRFEVERITKEKEKEMDELHDRVKKAISKKEETANLLIQQKIAAEKRAEHLEQLLTEQRKKILAK
ncbi:centrosomal protein of 131 kDa isoform X2 [Hydra vulgaris]|uniref:Centrosomal protein of 131 kDa isoform X2 n=1 Tax=Hydra vulgaris TaxID=6087 RepID=A0ABM4CF34_HYDVU